MDKWDLREKQMTENKDVWFKILKFWRSKHNHKHYTVDADVIPMHFQCLECNFECDDDT